MFTGIVREIGIVASVVGGEDGVRLGLSAPRTASALAVGDSVAVDGVCLTAETVENDLVSFHAVPETLTRTTIGRLRERDRVNVEPALRAGEPMGGHVVQGHVDGIGHARSVEPAGEGRRLYVSVPPELLRYVVEKGSVAVDGVSLTVAELQADAFVVALVPHTIEATTLGHVEAGSALNIETDVLAKYVERLIARA